MMKFIQLVVMVSGLILFISSCSDNSTGGDDDSTVDAKFTLSGDVQGEKFVQATFSS